MNCGHLGASDGGGDDRTPRRIDEEAVTVDALKHVLCTRCGCKDVVLNREENDPPDFTVTVDGETFAAEVTSIVFGESARARYEDLANAIRNHAAARCGVGGTYALVVSRYPQIPKPTASRTRPLLDAAAAYLDATRCQTAATPLRLAHDDSGQILIEKVSDKSSTVSVVWSAPAMWEGEIQRQLAALMQQAIDGKQGKLRGAGIDPRRTLLLLYDAFGLALPEDAVAALSTVRGYDAFHSIFWAAAFSDRTNATYPDEPGRDGAFLFTTKSEWSRNGGVRPPNVNSSHDTGTQLSPDRLNPMSHTHRRRVRSIVYQAKKLLRRSSLHREALMAERA